MTTLHDGSWASPMVRLVATAFDPLPLRSGERLSPVEVEFRSWGRPDANRGNAILVCHSFTGDSHAAGLDGTASAHWRPWRMGRVGWWDRLIGPGRAIDTRRWWVICPHVLGGTSSGTGPGSSEPGSGLPWAGRFPRLAIADMVAAQQRLMDQLDIPSWRLVVGGSMGGAQALTWALAAPGRVDRVLAVAAADRLGPAGRQHFRRALASIAADRAAGRDGRAGMLQALGSSRHFSGIGPEDDSDGRWSADWPPSRLQPEAFTTLGQALLDFDLAQDWGGGDLSAAVERIAADVRLVGYHGDRVFTVTAQARLAAAIRRTGGRAGHITLCGRSGHDSFLADPLQLAPLISHALSSPADLPAPASPR